MCRIRCRIQSCLCRDKCWVKGAVRGRSPSLRHVGDEQSVRGAVHYSRGELSLGSRGCWSAVAVSFVTIGRQRSVPRQPMLLAGMHWGRLRLLPQLYACKLRTACMTSIRRVPLMLRGNYLGVALITVSVGSGVLVYNSRGLQPCGGDVLGQTVLRRTGHRVRPSRGRASID